jgi:hypothetical protein
MIDKVNLKHSQLQNQTTLLVKITNQAYSGLDLTFNKAALYRSMTIGMKNKYHY